MIRSPSVLHRNTNSTVDILFVYVFVSLQVRSMTAAESCDATLEYPEDLMNSNMIDNIHNVNKYIVYGYFHKMQSALEIDIIPSIILIFTLIFYNDDGVFIQDEHFKFYDFILYSRPERVARNHRIAYNRSKHMVAIANNTTITICRFNDERQLQLLGQHKASIIALKFSYDGLVLLSRSAANMKLWKHNKGEFNCDSTVSLSTKQQSYLTELWSIGDESIFENILFTVFPDIYGKIFVYTLSGKTLQIEGIDTTDTILQLKKKIRDLEGIPVDQQRLIYINGKGMEDQNTLKHYQILPKSTIAQFYLVLRLRGNTREGCILQ